jgi:hypothetical protein
MITKYRSKEIVAYEKIEDNEWKASYDDNFSKWKNGVWWIASIREQFI